MPVVAYLLVESPLPDRWRGRCQTKKDTLVCQDGSYMARPVTSPFKTLEYFTDLKKKIKMSKAETGLIACAMK
jgi:hypothetical protein